MNFIKLASESDCCGCSACADICPVSCIEMTYNSEHFLYPKVDETRCLKCGKCQSACPVINCDKVKNPVNDDEAYAFVSGDDERVKGSSSGGAFSVIMDSFSDKSKNFSIVGAAFDGTNVVHKSVSSRESADIFRKSKYVQSDARGIYKKVEADLKDGRQVLFSGTPCMVAALKVFLGKDYEKLVTVDIVCHGVPCQYVFSKYLDEIGENNHCKVSSVSFRIKKGYETENPNPRTVDLVFDIGKTINLDIAGCEYLYGFHHGMFFRPSCYKCKFATPERPGDITLGDFWGIEKIKENLNSKKGVSLVRFNTEKGKEYLDDIKNAGDVFDTSYSFACDENYQLRRPAVVHRNRDRFFKILSQNGSVIESVNICKKPDTLARKVFRKVKKVVSK